MSELIRLEEQLEEFEMMGVLTPHEERLYNNIQKRYNALQAQRDAYPAGSFTRALHLSIQEDLRQCDEDSFWGSRL